LIEQRINYLKAQNYYINITRIAQAVFLKCDIEFIRLKTMPGYATHFFVGFLIAIPFFHWDEKDRL
jgi:hypothetical protein